MLHKSLPLTACLLALLALAIPAHAGGGVLGDAQETVEELLSDLPEPPEDPDGQSAVERLEGTTEQTKQRAESAAEDLQDAAEPDTLLDTLGDTIRPVRDQVDDAKRQVEELIEEDEPAPASEPTMEPQMEASVATGWEDLAEPVLLLGATALGLGALLWFLGQTATVGGGAAATAAARDGRRFLPYASPMFTRFEKDTVLGHPKREAIYGTIVGEPGITLQDLCKESGLSRTAVTHHLRLLEQQHLIVSKRVGRSRHFFENGGRYGRHQKEAYAVLHNERSKQISDFIQSNPGAIQKDLCQQFDIQASVAHWHIKRLVEANLVEAVRQGRTVSYFPGADVARAYA